MSKTIRNILIVMALAALKDVLPGGGTAASVALQAVYAAFLAILWMFASIMYRQHRSSLYALGEGKRATLYIALGVAFLTLTGTARLWASSVGTIAWCVLLVGAAYAVFAVLWSAREY
jgi:hypothetical protein